MATETLNPNAIQSQGSWTGVITDIDEAISGADGSTMDSVVDADPLDLDCTDSAVEDADTVTGITITARAKKIGSNNDSLAVTLLIGGVGQGTVNGANLGTSFTNEAFNDAGWDVDRSAADMDGLEIRIQTRTTGMPHSPDIQFDCADVDVAFDLPAAGANDIEMKGTHRGVGRGVVRGVG